MTGPELSLFDHFFDKTDKTVKCKRSPESYVEATKGVCLKWSKRLFCPVINPYCVSTRNVPKRPEMDHFDRF